MQLARGVINTSFVLVFKFSPIGKSAGKLDVPFFRQRKMKISVSALHTYRRQVPKKNFGTVAIVTYSRMYKAFFARIKFGISFMLLPGVAK